MSGTLIARRAAFTLLETLIVIGILAVIASVVIPAMRSRQTQSLEAAARKLAGDLRLARSLAVQHNTEWTVQFDFDENAYELVHTGSGNPPAPSNPLAPAGNRDDRYRVEVGRMGATSARRNGIRLAGAALKDSRGSVVDVTFGPLGGTGPARGEDTVVWLVTSADDDARYVRLVVSWVTGQVWLDPPKMFTGAGSAELFK